MSKPRVLLGMSGGTDSSVAAMKLQEEGYEVTGVTFRFYEPAGDTGYLDAARSLAERLGMEHLTVDVRREFRDTVVRYFTAEYLSARTPVPCTLCNNRLKWPLLARLANERDIPYLATGHYVRLVRQDGRYFLAPAADGDKDQSFFLWGLKQDILARMRLPLGGLTKDEVRAYALQRGFASVARRKDSIGVCFCPLDYRSFLRRELPAELLQKLPLSRDLSYRNDPFLFLFGTIYCSSSVLLALLSLLLARNGVPIWKLGLLVFSSFILLYWGAVVPYKAALHTRRDMGLELRKALGGQTEALTVYKYNTLAGLYPECHYMGGRIVTVKSASELPANEKVIYVLAPEVPSMPDRAWRTLLDRKYRNQRLALWRGELRDNENDE